MARAAQLTSSDASTISFELDRFELADGGRLELSGRWFGVRGRRFIRPTLTLRIAGAPYRSLADLDHKPWAAEHGEQWDAVFPLGVELVDVDEAELNVAPDITVPLPAPRAVTRSRRASKGKRAPAAKRKKDPER